MARLPASLTPEGGIRRAVALSLLSALVIVTDDDEAVTDESGNLITAE